MEIVIGKTAGFCYGVKNAVEKSTEELKKENQLYCLGEIVHNSKVVNELESKGLITIDNLNQNEEGLKTIIRAHGVSKQVYEEAKQNKIELIDLTCPMVLKIHKIASEYEEKGHFIFVVGNKNHPETVGTVGFCGNNYVIIEHEEDIDNAIEELKNSGIQNLLIIVQTTFSLEKFNKYTDIIREKIEEGKNNINIEIVNTICNATRIRQEETDKISKEVDYMIIIGGKNSSNTKKLFEIAAKNCPNTICIEDSKELDIENIKKSNKVGIMAGASTPQRSIEEVVNMLENT